ncbi:hypothetical protein JCM10212_000696 [Sporobolomyces blumeae]
MLGFPTLLASSALLFVSVVASGTVDCTSLTPHDGGNATHSARPLGSSKHRKHHRKHHRQNPHKHRENGSHSGSTYESTTSMTKKTKTIQVTREATKTTSRKPSTKTTSASKPTSTSGSSGSGSGSLSTLAQESLKYHNEFRAKYQAAPLTWSNELASAAQAWADKCSFEHGGGTALKSGENLAAYYGKSNVEYAVSLWTDEAKSYSYTNPGFSLSTGHFTQLVWKATTQVGCAEAYCDPIKFPGSTTSWSGTFYVCEYLTAGNVLSQFTTNVLPAI